MVGPASTRLYIYAEFLEANALWLATNFDVTVDGGAAITDIGRYNAFTRVGPRWTGGGGTVNNPQNASYRGAWIGNPNNSGGGVWNWDAAFSTMQTGNPISAADTADNHYLRTADPNGGPLGTTLLGFVDVENAGAFAVSSDLFMTVESPIFAKFGGGGNERVFFGYLDASVGGGEIGVRTSIADATVVPEPASLMLLGLGALALRRRR